MFQNERQCGECLCVWPGVIPDCANEQTISVLIFMLLRGLFPVYRWIWQWSISYYLCVGYRRLCFAVFASVDAFVFLWIIKLLWGWHSSVFIWHPSGNKVVTSLKQLSLHMIDNRNILQSLFDSMTLHDRPLKRVHRFLLLLPWEPETAMMNH